MVKYRRMVEIPVHDKTRSMIKKLKGALSYDEFFQERFGGKQ